MKVFATGVKVALGGVHILKDMCKGYHFPIVKNQDKIVLGTFVDKE